MAKIIIPTPLRKFTENQASYEANGQDVASSIGALTEQFPAVKKHLIDEEGKLRSFVRVYVGDEDIHALEGEATPVAESTVISIIPAIAGGIQ